jgi:hypothetical protein
MFVHLLRVVVPNAFSMVSGFGGLVNKLTTGTTINGNTIAIEAASGAFAPASAGLSVANQY